MTEWNLFFFKCNLRKHEQKFPQRIIFIYRKSSIVTATLKKKKILILNIYVPGNVLLIKMKFVFEEAEIALNTDPYNTPVFNF